MIGEGMRREMEELVESYVRSQVEYLCSIYKLDYVEAMEELKRKNERIETKMETKLKGKHNIKVKNVGKGTAKLETDVAAPEEAKLKEKVAAPEEAKLEAELKENVPAPEEAKLEAELKEKVPAPEEAKLEAELKEKVAAPEEAKLKEKVAAPEGKKKKGVVKERKLEMEIELPFSGEIDEERCKGIRTAGKLYTQCLTYVSEERYCKKCMKESSKNSNGKPNNGDMLDRKEAGLYEYKDKDGKNPWPYYKLMRKHGWSREYVEEIGKKNGIKISIEHYNEEEMKKKVPQKGRGKGRPKKEEVGVEVEKKEEVEEKEEVKVVEEELKLEEAVEEEEEEEIVEEIEYKGEKYLRSKRSGLIYDKNNMEDPQVLGIWDSRKEEIDFSYVEESDEEEE